MDNKKKLTVVLCVFALVCIFAVLVFSGVIDINKIVGGGEEPTTTDSSVDISGDNYKAGAAANGSASLPYLESYIDDLYYTVSTDGDVRFYMYKPATKEFEEVPATGEYEITVTMSETPVSAVLTYYKDGDKIAGYGLYRGKDGEYNLYPYAFFSLVNYGEKYKKTDKGCLLLVDTDADDFYVSDKTYDEAFNYTYGEKTASRLLSEANRTVGINGTKRSDYTIINKNVIDVSSKYFIFFSGRRYAEDDERVDLYRSGGSGNNVDNILVAEDILGYWTDDSDDGIIYVYVNEKGNVCVGCYNQASGKAGTVKSSSIKREDVIVSNGYIYNIKTNSVIDIEDEHKEVKLAYTDAASFIADTFFVEDGKLLLRGYKNGTEPVVILASCDDGKVIGAYTNNDLKKLVNPMEVGDSIMYTVVSVDSFDYCIN